MLLGLMLIFFQDVQAIFDLAQSEPEKALVLAQEAWSNPSHPNREEVGLALVTIHRKLDHWEEMKTIIEALLDGDFSSDTKIQALTRFAAMARETRDQDAFPHIEEHYQKLKGSLAKNEPTSKLYAEMGSMFLKNAQFSKAETYLAEGLKVTPDTSETKIELHSNLGVSFAQQGKLHDGLEHMILAEKLYQTLKGEESINYIKNIGGIMVYLEKWEDSIAYTERALRLAGSTPSQTVVSLYNNLGTAQLNLKQTEAARASFQRGLDMAKSLNYQSLSLLNNMGFLLIDEKEFQKALPYLLEAEKAHEASKAFENLAIARKNIGQAYQGLGQYEKAGTYFQSSYDLYAEHDLRSNRLELFPVFIENWIHLGNYRKAYELMKEYKALNDESTALAAKVEVEDLQSKYELEKKEKELIQATHAQQSQAIVISELEKEKQIQKQIRWYLMVGLFAAMAMLLLLFRSLRFRKQAHYVLSEKNSHIEKQKVDLESLNEMLKQQSYEDALTGLKNRRCFDLIMEDEQKKMARAIQNNSVKPMLFILADLDHFKSINDTYGHHVGDRVLQLFSNCLKEAARASDITVRWGGEEFLWVCRDAAFEDGPRLCDRLREILAKKAGTVPEVSVPITVSLGFATYPFLPTSSELIHSLKVADMALYRAKSGGRDGWVGYQNQQPMEKTPTSQDLEESAKQGLFDLTKSPHLSLA
ncbi:MAG: diguanylate cyclase [Acidobacteria bacterium]|nr:diguanylate cyclase [Acidobacteriota bacterium]